MNIERWQSSYQYSYSEATVADELLVIERQTVAVAILQEKRVKLQGMVEGSREIPRELKAVRNLPDLGPSYVFCGGEI